MTRTKQHSLISPVDIFNQGRERLTTKGDEAESTKLHTLRGGSAGCVTELGEFIGANPYTTLARFMGFQTKHPVGTFDIFDTGRANEHLWETYLAETDWVVRMEEDYPLVVNDVFPYPLTGRPDAVLGSSEDGTFTPKLGVELKAICSANTAKIFKSMSPKTENLIQSAVYSMFFDLPWCLVYSSGSSYFSVKAGKIEFPCYWRDGTFGFVQPNGTKQNTMITEQGIKDYYLAICEAFDTKDHSFFRRANVGWDGEPAQYWDEYNSFLLAVDSQWEWSKWVEYAEAASQSDVVICLKKVNKKSMYSLENTVTGRTESMHANLEDARGVLYGKILS